MYLLQTEVCSSALTDVIHAVINGSDGCLFCFGHAGLGKLKINTYPLKIIQREFNWIYSWKLYVVMCLENIVETKHFTALNNVFRYFKGFQTSSVIIYLLSDDFCWRCLCSQRIWFCSTKHSSSSFPIFSWVVV